MMISIDSMESFKVGAKRLKKNFPHLRLSQAQALLSRVLGYRDLYQLQNSQHPAFGDSTSVEEKVLWAADRLAKELVIDEAVAIRTIVEIRVPYIPKDLRSAGMNAASQ